MVPPVKSRSSAKAVVPLGKTTKTGTPPAKPGSKLTTTDSARPRPGRLFLGMLALLVALYVVQFLLYFIDLKTRGALEHPTFVTLPLLGKVTPMVLLFLVIIVGLYWAMIKYNIIPRPVSAAQLAANRAANTANKSTTGKTALNTATGKNVATKGSTKNSVVPKGTNTRPITVGKPKATTKTGETEMVGAHAKVTGGVAGDNDEMYQQVKAQLRAQARRRRK